MFVRDLDTGLTTLVSRAAGPAGATADNASLGPSISDDGRYVTFESFASNLDPADTDNTGDVFVRDMQAGTTTLVDRATGPNGAKGTLEASGATISGDGRYVAFVYGALSPSNAPFRQVFVRDLQAHTTTVVSRTDGASGALGNGSANADAISSDGRYVAFNSGASNLDPEDRNRSADVFVRDGRDGTTRLASRATGADGAIANVGADGPVSISADGRYVTFASKASNLDPADPDATEDVFVRDLQAETTTLVSRATGASAAKGNAASTNASISGDGHVVAFASLATNLDPADGDSISDVFVREVPPGSSTIVSDAALGPEVARTVVIRSASGTVLVRSPGSSAFAPLSGARLLPVGTEVDATKGRIRLTSAASAGGTHHSEFFGGTFQIIQHRSRTATTDLKLRSPKLAGACGAAVRAAAATGQSHRQAVDPGSRPRRSKRVVSHVSGSGHGPYTIVTGDVAASSQGTIWLVQQRCDGTLTTVRRGVVRVLNLHTHRTVTVVAGRSYLARR